MIDPRRALVSHAIGCEVVRRAVEALEPAAIPVVVLKGAWLQSCVCAEDDLRAITDVDLLVPEAAFASALQRLERAGWERRSADLRQQCLAHRDLQLPLDLHRRLFTRGAFNLPTSAVFARAHRDHVAFGVDVNVPDARDGLAHLLGHYVKSRIPRADPERVADFAIIARRCRLDPADCAQHLHAAGLARAARYVLDGLPPEQHVPFFGELIAALPRDRVGRSLARLSQLIDSSAERGRIGSLPGFLLDRSLLAGAGAFALRTLELHHERRRDFRHTAGEG